VSKREFLAKEAMVEPEQIIDQLVDYLLFLKSKGAETDYDALLLSYPTLSKDWLSPEEDHAWKDYQ
jgi:hypothetical protein